MGRRVAPDIRRDAREPYGSGDVPTPVFSGILDALSASAAGAWSVNDLLRAAYAGNALRVRNGTTNVETDVGFSGGLVDTDAIAAACGSDDGFVVTVYDQSGNGRDLTNATAANQPKIYDGTTGIILGGSNNVVAMEFDGTTHRLTRTDSCGFSGNAAITMFGNFQLDGGITTTRTLFGLGLTPSAGITSMAHSLRGATNQPGVNFTSDFTAYTLDSNPAATTWQSVLIAREAGALTDNDGTQYAIDGVFLTASSSSDPGGTLGLSSSATSWGGPFGQGTAYFAGLASTRLLFTSQIVEDSADELTLFAWAAQR